MSFTRHYDIVRVLIKKLQPWKTLFTKKIKNIKFDVYLKKILPMKIVHSAIWMKW